MRSTVAILPLALAASLASLAAPSLARAAASPAATREALGILRDECLSCHNPEKKKGGLVLTTREALLRGGSEGPALTPGQPDSSRLLALLAPGADPHMPPKKQLSPAQVRALREWIRQGAAWDAAALQDEANPPRAVALSPIPGQYRPVVALALSPDARHLAIGRPDRLEVRDLSATDQPVVGESEVLKGGLHALAWSPDGRWIASGGFREIVLWEGPGLRRERGWSNGLVGPILSLAFSPDAALLAAGDGEPGRPGFVRLHRTATGAAAGSWRAHGDSVLGLDFSRDGQRLASAGADRLVRVWNPGSREELATLEGHTAQVLAVAFNTNGTQVVSGGADQQLKVWDIATREKIITLGTHSAPVSALAWPGDGQAVFAATDAGRILRYTNLKPHTGEQSSASGDERQLAKVADPAQALVVSADGKVIAAGSHDGTVLVWNQDGKQLARFDPPASPSPANPTIPSLPVASERRPSTPSDRPAQVRRPALPPGFKPAAVSQLQAEPARLRLSGDAPRHQILLTATLADGFEVDVTSHARFRADRRGPVRVSDTGEIFAERPGTGTVTARLGRHEVEIPVTVDGEPGATSLASPPPTFVRDVLPSMNRAGCSAGACHAKADGQNGFKLSVFSYDPKHDYGEIVNDARGRRIAPATPDESLLLRKPLGRVPHEGGQRFAEGSDTHRLILRWIAGGMPLTATNEPVLEKITVLPSERRYHQQASQQLLVQAHYSDGSVRDVTRLASYGENDKEIARVDENGRLTVGTLTGQGVIVARYMGFVADSQVLVPAEKLLPPAQYAALPVHNFIDTLAHEQFQRLGLLPSDLCTDAEFLRRASLDTIGVLPTAAEVRAFLEAGTAGDEAARRDHRRKLIERLLGQPEFGDYWANKWADLLRPNSDRVGVKSVLMLDNWLRETFQNNVPYDRFVREILLAEGSNHRDGPAVIYRDRREPAELTTMFSQLFLGTRLECAKCHHHPNEKWSQDDFYQLAAFFGPVKQKGAGLSPPISAGTETFYFAPGGTVKHPVTGETMTPRPPDGPMVQVEKDRDPRRALADWLTAPENPFFARAAVNRVWAAFFGRGLVEPVDDFRISNPCVNSPLLDALARDFATHGYDFKHLIRTILESRLYQLSSTPNDTNLRDTRYFSRAYRRRLPAEVLLDAVNDLTGVPDTYAAVPTGFRAMQTWSYKIESHFLDAFGRPNSSSDCPCERDRQMSVVQALHLMHSRNLQSKLASPAGRVRQMAEGSKPPDEIATELYLATLGRPPAEEELRTAVAAYTAPNATRQTATEDLLWALLNSPEFLFNH